LLSTECSEGNFRIAAYTTTGNYAVQYGDYINDLVALNKWTYLVYTYDNRNEKIYIDGTLKYSNFDQVTENLNYCSPFTIGAKAAPAYDRWQGKIDELRVYSRVLTQEEITYLANN
ncbi:MAG: LamG domain-containing protein, partial [Bacteroidota bacterium]